MGRRSIKKSALAAVLGAVLGVGQAMEPSLLAEPMLLMWIIWLEHPLQVLIGVILLVLIPTIIEQTRSFMAKLFRFVWLIVWLAFVSVVCHAVVSAGFGVLLLILSIIVLVVVYASTLGSGLPRFLDKLTVVFRHTPRSIGFFASITLFFLPFILATTLIRENEVSAELVQVDQDGVVETRVVPFSVSLATPANLAAQLQSAVLGRDQFLLFGKDRSFVWDGEAHKARVEKSGRWEDYRIVVAGGYALVAGQKLDDTASLGSNKTQTDPLDLWVYEPRSWYQGGRPGALNVRRRDYQMIALDKNQVLVVGGRRLPLTDQSPASQGIPDVELVSWFEGWDIQVERLPDMLTGRWRHRLVRLHDGRVMAVGGDTTRTEIFDPRTRRWSDAGNFREPNEKGSSIDLNVLALPDGRVAIVDNPLRLWDPASRRWQAVVLSVFPGHQSVAMGDASIFSLNGSSSTVLDTRTHKIRPGPTLKYQRKNPALVALSNGKVHVIGGTTADGKKIHNHIEIVRVAKAPKETGPLEAPIAFTAPSKLKDGRVLLAGNWGIYGEDPRKSEIIEIGATEILPPRQRQERKSLGPAPAAFPMPDGSVVVAGGDPVVAQRWSADTGNWSLIPELEFAASPVHGRAEKLEEIVQRANSNLVTFNATLQTDRANETRVSQWDPVTGKLQTLAPMQKLRTGFSALELADGRIAVGGGWEIEGYIALDNDCSGCQDEFVPIGGWKNAFTTESYDFKSNQWTAGPDSRHAGGTIVRLPDGRVVKVSSIEGDKCTGAALEVAGVDFESWKSVTCPTGKIDASHVVVLGHRVLLVGSALGPENPVAIWNAKQDRWTEWRPDRYMYIHKILALDEWRLFVLGSVGDRRIYTTVTMP